MNPTVAAAVESRHRVIPETRPQMLRADLRKTETRTFWAEIGACLERAMPATWTLDMLAESLKRDPRQVRRWIAGEEQTQVAVVFGVAELRQPFVVELARLAQCDITTQITIRRTS